jgi:predicted Zn-dependent peptidase
MTIGAADDIRAMQLEDVQSFFRTYYHPANASLAIAGDIDTARAFDLAEHYFGDLPPGPRPGPVRTEAHVQREIRLVLDDRVEMPRVYMAWHSPAMFGAGDAEMDLAADLLGNGKTSRLYRSLVYEKRLALDVSAYQSSRELGSFFLMAATAAPGRSLTDIAAVIDTELQALADEGPRPTRWNVPSPRPKRTSCTACRPWAASEESRISSTRTMCSRATLGFLRRISAATGTPRPKAFAQPSGAISDSIVESSSA